MFVQSRLQIFNTIFIFYEVKIATAIEREVVLARSNA